MKKFIVVCIICCGCVNFLSAFDLVRIRTLFFQSVTNAESLEQSFHLLKVVTVKDQPVFQGYKGMCYMMMANHAINPFIKYKYFKIGKGQLEEAIRIDINSIELRFLRLTIQTNVPSILNYAENITADKQLIMKSLHLMKDEDFKNKIANYLINKELCNDLEKMEILNQ